MLLSEKNATAPVTLALVAARGWACKLKVIVHSPRQALKFFEVKVYSSIHLEFFVQLFAARASPTRDSSSTPGESFYR